MRGVFVSKTVLAKSTKMCYTYDNLNRVTKRTLKDLNDVVLSEETFTYDAAGNITDAPDSCFQYDTNNRLIVFNGNSVSYDMDGNMLSNGTLTCTYDSANRLITAGGHTYTYNAEDIRIRNLCSDADTTYTYDTNCKLSKLLCKTTNGITTKYVYGRGLIGEEKCNTFKTYHFDYRGSTVAITDASGNITDTFEYDTYGKLMSRTGTSLIIFGYNGRDGVVTDKNGLIYMRARYYSPDMRRFVNADIIAGKLSNAITLNRFAYANGNPVSFVDPFGLSVERGQPPTELEAAYMAQHIYDVLEDHIGTTAGQSYGGWTLIDIKTNEEGLKIGVYAQTINGVISYAVVNAGSESNIKEDIVGVWDDWVNNNITQPFGNSQDMEDSIYFAKEFVKNNPNANITFIGHSKGGAEAVANAIATNKNAIIFNPARANYLIYGLSTEGYNGNVTSYVVEGEFLSCLYDKLEELASNKNSKRSKVSLIDILASKLIDSVNDYVMMSPQIGKTIMLPSQGNDAITNHTMQSVIDALKNRNKKPTDNSNKAYYI